MKSPEIQIAIDVLTFPWDRNASSATRRCISSDVETKRSFEIYFDFLEEVKPHPHELRLVRAFEKPFTLV